MSRRPGPMALSTAIIALGAVTLYAPAAPAQLRDVRIGSGVALESYSFSTPAAAGIERITLLTIPIGARVDLTPRVRLEASGGYARGSLTRADGTDVTLSGFTDTVVGVTALLARGLLTLGGSLVLPSGNSTQTLEQAEVAGAVAADLLPFRISNWGSGGGVDVNAGVSVPVAGFGLGARMGYRLAREFEPLENEPFGYRPGNQFHLRLAADRTVGTAGKATLALTLRRFATDAVDGSNLFRTGDRLEVVGSYAFPVGFRASAVAFGGVLHRSRGAFLDGSDRMAPARDLFLLGARFRVPTSRILLLPGGEIRVFRSSDGVGQGYVAGVGGAAEIPLGSRGMIAVPSLRARFGTVLVREAVESGFTGLELGLGVRFQDARP